MMANTFSEERATLPMQPSVNPPVHPMHVAQASNAGPVAKDARLFATYHALLAQFVSFATVSTDPRFKSQIGACVEWLRGLFMKHDFAVSIKSAGASNPIIVARKIVDPSYKTVLIYGHYDVQPAETDGWLSDPFVLTTRNGKWWGRGVVDDKGQVLAHVVSIFDLLDQGECKKNIVFVIEGNEETGGSGLATVLRRDPQLFACDSVLISDGEIPYSPVIEASFRGVANVELRLTTANCALHSGIYGGAVPSASEEMVKLLASLKDASGRVLIPGFYDHDVLPDTKQLAECDRLDALRTGTIVAAGLGKPIPNFTAKTGFSSMLEISGLRAGYGGEGFSNIVPHNATAKINLRLAGRSDPQSIVNALIEFINARVPVYAKLDVVIDEMVAPAYIDVTTPLHESIRELLRDVYGKDVATNYCGATIPIISEFIRVLGVQPLLVPLGNDDCNMHGANENYDIALAKKALELSSRFFSQ